MKIAEIKQKNNFYIKPLNFKFKGQNKYFLLKKIK